MTLHVQSIYCGRNKCRRVDVCDLLLKRQKNDPFLKCIIIGDEERVVYNNVKRKRSWSKKDEQALSTSKADIRQKKVMLSVWWDFKDIVFLDSTGQHNDQFWGVLSPAEQTEWFFSLVENQIILYLAVSCNDAGCLKSCCIY